MDNSWNVMVECSIPWESYQVYLALVHGGFEVGVRTVDVYSKCL
jgi:hypothetical protein